MQRHENWRALPASVRGAAVALGNFDGVHRGHAHVLASTHAARPDAPLAVLTFEPHPREMFRPDDPPFRLSLPSARADQLGALGVQHVIEVAFDREFSLLSADEFITQVLHDAVGAVHLACGPDFAFGHRRGGDVPMLTTRAEAYGMGLTIVPPLADALGPISSTRIRRALQDGYPERATDDLGRPWSIRGIVSHGDARGRTIGFPTANIALGRQLEPARGVYAVTALLDGRVVPGVANIGRRPTVADGTLSRVEAHFFDFMGDLYGQELDVSLHAFLRLERKFAGIEELRDQIASDAAEARRLLGA
jgi:riboflavin kinase/FMN adenylyltransferase